jgi:chloramphenicol-sensitive protein RarD
VLAYGTWGIFPLYWKLLKSIPHLEVLAHRMVWSAVFLSIVLLIQERRRLWTTLSQACRYLHYTLLSAFFISINWFVYIYAVNSDHVLESSLGYFMAPLVSVFLGTVVLHEKLKRLQQFAVFLATLGVMGLIYQCGTIPYFSILLSITFSIYGFIRKKIPLPPLVASTLEAILQIIPALIILFFFSSQTTDAPLSHPSKTPLAIGLLILGGIITALPLLWFANAARRLPLSTLGLLNYLSPILQFLLAVFFFHENFTLTHLIAFSFIWMGLILYTLQIFYERKTKQTK